MKAYRYVFAVMASAGMAIIYGLKVNLSIAIVSMVNHTAVQKEGTKYEHQFFAAPPGANSVDGPFPWPPPVQQQLLAAYFYGYMATQVLGGVLAEYLSAKHFFGIATLMNVVPAILSPLLAKWSPWAFFVGRVIQGLGGGMTFPAMHILLSNWSPKDERSRMSSMVYAGTALGTVFSLLLSGLTAAAVGWEWVFYSQGAASMVWYVGWVILVSDSPQKSRFVSEEERDMILASFGRTADEETVRERFPIGKAFTSMPFLAIIVGHVCGNWGWYMLLVELPIYMSSILGFSLSGNAVLSSVPYFCMWIFGMFLGAMGTKLLQKKTITVTVFRKAMTGMSYVTPAVLLVAVTFVQNPYVAVGFITIAVMGIAGMYSGYLSNHIDIAPMYAGTLMGISNTFATLPGFGAPAFVGFMTSKNNTVGQWRIIFIITAAIYAFGFIFYMIFASGEVQEWGKPKVVEAPPTEEAKEAGEDENKQRMSTMSTLSESALPPPGQMS